MKILLVDNVDSFTLNLADYLFRLGATVTVIAHTDPLPELADFDAAVISPGPGNPHDPASLGCSRELIDAASSHSFPVLGICLGMQALAVAAGGEVARTAHAMHGRVDDISHTGHPLFASIPRQFEATRYHSLAVQRVPECFDVIARSADRVVQALAHRSAPLYGVQFHPESICSPSGMTLLHNFLMLAAKHGGRLARVHTSDREVDAEALYRRLRGTGPASAWLTSPDDRFTYCGASDHLMHTTFQTPPELPTVFFDRDTPEIGRLKLGWVGYVGYEAEETNQWMWLDRMVVIDHARRCTHVVYIGDRDARVDELITAVGELPCAVARDRHSAHHGSAPQRPRVHASSPLRCRDSREEYLDKIARAQQYIADGDTYEVCLTTQLSMCAHIDPLEAFLYLRHAHPSPYSALLEFPDVAVVSTSPEKFLSISADGHAESKPIKGTRPRDRNPQHDRELAEQLRDDEKERAENLMIVDLVRHDLTRSCLPGSVAVDALFAVESFASTHQLVSTISGTLSPTAHPWTCVRDCFPGGSMTGAPKESTMAILRELEGAPRGIYSGGLGYLSSDGAVELAMVIRTLVIRPDELSYGVGGAITALSNPAREWDEVKVKSRVLCDLLNSPFPE